MVGGGKGERERDQKSILESYYKSYKVLKILKFCMLVAGTVGKQKIQEG